MTEQTLDADVLVGELVSSDGQTRERARERLQALGPEAIGPLLTAVAQYERQAARVRRLALSVLSGTLAVLVLLALLAVRYPWIVAVLPFLAWSGLMFGSGHQDRVVRAVSGYWRAREGQRYVLLMLGKVGNVQAVGPILRAAVSQEPRVQDKLRRAVAAILRNARASDADRVSSDDLATCYRELDRSPVGPGVPAAQLAILQLLEQIGTEDAIPHVEGLAQRSWAPGSAPGVRKAALDCLEVVRTRAERSAATRVLLRPSSSPQGEGLLRPAAGAPDSPAEPLLRPAEASQETPEERLLRPARGE